MSIRDPLVLTINASQSHLGPADHLLLPMVSCHTPDLPLSILIPTLLLHPDAELDTNAMNQAILLVVCSKWSHDELEDLVQIFFEKAGVAALAMVDEGLACLWACGIVTGIVVDFDFVDIWVDSLLVARRSGYREHTKDQGEDYMFDKTKDGLTVQEAILECIHEVEIHKRGQLYDSIILSGPLIDSAPRVKKEVLELLQRQDTNGNTRDLRFVKIPEYMTMYKGRNELMSYLGGAVVAKMMFSGNSFISRQDYNTYGPAAAHLK